MKNALYVSTLVLSLFAAFVWLKVIPEKDLLQKQNEELTNKIEDVGEDLEDCTNSLSDALTVGRTYKQQRDEVIIKLDNCRRDSVATSVKLKATNKQLGSVQAENRALQQDKQDLAVSLANTNRALVESEADLRTAKAVIARQMDKNDYLTEEVALANATTEFALDHGRLQNAVHRYVLFPQMASTPQHSTPPLEADSQATGTGWKWLSLFLLVMLFALSVKHFNSTHNG